MTRDVKRDVSAGVGLEPAGYSESSSIELRFWVRTSFWSWMRRACWIAVSRRRRSTSDLGAGRPVGRVGMVFCVFLRIDLGGADVDAMVNNGGFCEREIFSKTGNLALNISKQANLSNKPVLLCFGSRAVYVCNF